MKIINKMIIFYCKNSLLKINALLREGWSDCLVKSRICFLLCCLLIEGQWHGRKYFEMRKLNNNVSLINFSLYIEIYV
jgi:hypothetical protein